MLRRDLGRYMLCDARNDMPEASKVLLAVLIQRYKSVI